MRRSAMPSITAGRPFNTTSLEGGCFCNGEKGLLLGAPIRTFGSRDQSDWISVKVVPGRSRGHTPVVLIEC